MRKVGCKPFYLTSQKDLPFCTDRGRIQEITSSLALGGNHEILPPCKAIEKINYKHEINDLSGTAWDSKNHFWVTFIMQDIRFKVKIEPLCKRLLLYKYNIPIKIQCMKQTSY